MTKRKDPAPAVELIEQSELFEVGTGTDGPAPVRRPQLVSAAGRRPPVQVSYRVALRQCMDSALDILRERGEQWPPDARQDLISTLFIAACREKRVVFDFQPEVSR